MLQLVENLEVKAAAATRALEIVPVRRSGGSMMDRSFGVDRLTLFDVHDLRNPLSAICGSAELLAAGTLGPEQTRRIAANIRRASEQMKYLLSSFARSAKGHDATPAIGNLWAILHASCIAAGLNERPDIDLTIDVSPEIDLRVEIKQLERVFLNLIVNAMEAMPYGGALFIAASATTDRVRITVEDTGPGIPAMIRDRLFEPFATAGKADGMGLGLAISRQAVRNLGGELWAESCNGARFAMWLPRETRTEGVPGEAK